MSKIESLGAKAKDSADWNRAWSVISQLAAARGTTLRELGEGDRSASIAPTVAPKPGSSSAPIPAPVAPDQLARDITEIERASAALRQAEPDLEPHAPDPQASLEPRTPRSIWLVVGIIWLTAVAVVSCAIAAIVLLLG